MCHWLKCHKDPAGLEEWDKTRCPCRFWGFPANPELKDLISHVPAAQVVFGTSSEDVETFHGGRETLEFRFPLNGKASLAIRAVIMNKDVATG